MGGFVKDEKLSSVHILFPFVPTDPLLSFFFYEFAVLVPIFLFIQYRRNGLTYKEQFLS